jgi:8-oxo-dGTP pyrophosphatase MutT (NUDIX family)
MNLQSEIEAALDRCVAANDRVEYQARLIEGALVRDENIHSHCCAYFAPYNPATKQILLGDHKKSGLWLMPGGHIDANETLLTTLNRKIEEELGVSNFYTQRPEPFLLSITNIVTDVRPCQKHFDVWHVMETDGEGLEIDYTEYNEVRWVTIEQARALVTDPANLMALDKLEKL